VTVTQARASARTLHVFAWLPIKLDIDNKN